jgi:putative membrane protein
MRIAASALVGLVAVLHVYFLVLEMFLFTKPFGLKTFRLTAEAAQTMATMAANQGLYNGFLAAGLVWGLVRGDRDVINFFLVCVVIAGVYGAATVNKRILFIQALPAAIAGALLWMSA